MSKVPITAQRRSPHRAAGHEVSLRAAAIPGRAMPLSTSGRVRPHALDETRDCALNIAMGDEIDEVIEFLSDKKPAVREQAMQIVQGLTGTDDGAKLLYAKADALVPKLLHALGAEGGESKYAATALVNLTHDPEVITKAVGKGVIERAMDGLRDGDGAPVDLLLSILANVTTAESGVHVLSQEGKPLEGFWLSKLIQLLSTGTPEADYDQAASVLTNVTRDPIGRRVFLDPKRGLLASVIPFMTQSNELRRERVAAALRNCCMDDVHRKALLNFVSPGSEEPEGEIVRALLRPISGKKVGAELSDNVRQACAEAIFALAKDEEGRELLGKLEAPRTLRDGYELEEHAETCAALVATGDLFLKHGMVPEDLQEGLNQPQAVEVIGDDEALVMGPGFGGGGFINSVD